MLFERDFRHYFSISNYEIVRAFVTQNSFSFLFKLEWSEIIAHYQKQNQTDRFVWNFWLPTVIVFALQPFAFVFANFVWNFVLRAFVFLTMKCISSNLWFPFFESYDVEWEWGAFDTSTNLLKVLLCYLFRDVTIVTTIFKLQMIFHFDKTLNHNAIGSTGYQKSKSSKS